MEIPDTAKLLGIWLAELRTGREPKLSQTRLAQLVGTEERNIRRWEKGDAVPEGLTLLKLLRVLDVEITPPPPGYLTDDAKLRHQLDQALRSLEYAFALLAGRQEPAELPAPSGSQLKAERK